MTKPMKTFLKNTNFPDIEMCFNIFRVWWNKTKYRSSFKFKLDEPKTFSFHFCKITDLLAKFSGKLRKSKNRFIVISVLCDCHLSPYEHKVWTNLPNSAVVGKTGTNRQECPHKMDIRIICSDLHFWNFLRFRVTRTNSKR